MRGSSLLPKRFRESSERGWFNIRVTKFLQAVARRACIHPIHTIVVVALLASTTYVGLLDGSLFDSAKGGKNRPDHLDVSNLLQGGRNLRLGESTGWRWQVDDSVGLENDEVRLKHV